MLQSPKLRIVLALLLVVASSGCSSQNTNPQHGEHEHEDGDNHAHEEGHDHPAEGPHHGSLIELGSEEYHAELVHDDAADTVTIYILDSSAKKAVPIGSSEISINISHEGQGEQFNFAATPEESDPDGKTSRFVSKDKDLASELDHDHAEAQIVITIDGKQFRGSIEHHDHGHDHE